MEQFFGFRNFRQFERSRKEIRLPYDLLNDLRFRQLPDASKAHLICLLLLSARMDNLLPNNPIKLEQLIGATDSVDLSAFADFVAFAQVDEPTYEDRAAKRRIPEPMRGGGAAARRRAVPQVPNGNQSRSRSHNSGQQGRENRRGKPADALPALQPAQMEEAGCPILTSNERWHPTTPQCRR
jgi:hypothetical protein